MYDFIIVGSGLFGCTFANLAKQNNKKCLIIEKRKHPFGNCYTETHSGINIHKYGPHTFHTNNGKIWEYVNQFDTFNSFINRPKVKFGELLYSFPINLMTLYQLWGVSSPEQAQQKLNETKIYINNPSNLEEWALSQVGQEIYEIFIKGYTKKQWNTDPKNLPPFLIKRLPIRLSFEDNYYYDRYQGIPINGYSSMMQNMVGDIEIVLETDYLSERDKWDGYAKRIVYTGAIDEFFDTQHGRLGYRSLDFCHETHSVNDYQGNAIINYTEESVPYTRIIEHKHFTFGDNLDKTIITKEYPADLKDTNEKYYPINTTNNDNLYTQYKDLSKNIANKYIFGGRLAEYKYYDMHQIIASAHHIYQKYL
ncbi:MAG: UDP-galactopyranose mutase [Synechococcus sp.]|nr:UDP-galactopyranose mutase [Synechococcus sp.]